MKVLLVDDDPFMAVMVGAVIDETGDAVIVVERGLQAVTRARAVSPDVVMLDMMLPDCSGAEVLKAFRDAPDMAALPIVICSASADEAQLAHMIANGATGTIPKPFDPVTLRDQLKKHLPAA